MKEIVSTTPSRHMMRALLAMAVVICAYLFAASPALAETFDVNSVGDLPDTDTSDNVCRTNAPGDECTLRAAIQQSNVTPSIDRITFSIGRLGGTQNIGPAGQPLPSINQGVEIDGTTQEGFDEDTRQPLIGLSGQQAGPDANGLFITSLGVTVRGLAIYDFERNGIYIETNRGAEAQGSRIVGNYIGTDITGNRDTLGNGLDGVYIQDSANNVIGGTTAEDRNVISANGRFGVQIASALRSDAGGNVVSGNYIGTDVTGEQDLGNVQDGVIIVNTSDNTIGGATAGASNVISGNNRMGVLIGSNFGRFASGNEVSGNYIGTDKDGEQDLGNSLRGVEINDSPNNTVGGTTAAHRNVISGNGSSGVLVTAGAENDISANYIGTDKDGEQALRNSGNGVTILESSGNTVGGTTAGRRNVISGNGSSGVLVTTGATDNEVSGNYVGTDKDGEQDLGNTVSGVAVQNASGNTVGGTGRAAGNVISGNDFVGIDITGSSGNEIRNNRVGTNAAATAPIKNAIVGITVKDDSDDNTLTANTVGANGNGVEGGISIIRGSSGNEVRGNFIGTNAAINADLGNAGSGVRIGEASDNTIGGPQTGDANVIAFNDSRGVSVTSGTDNAILSNSIFSNGDLGIDLNENGVTANDPDDPDTGANDLQNFPVLDSATMNSTGATRVTGTLDSAPNRTFTIQFFANPEADPSGNGEGEYFLGEQEVETDADGDAAIDFTATEAWFGESITATATSPRDDTSEFSGGVEVVAVPPPSLSIDDVTVTEGDAGTTNANFTVTREGDASGSSTVDYRTVPSTATSPYDYQQTSGTLTFAPGETEKEIIVPVNGDEVDENDERFFVNLSNPNGATVADGDETGVGTITDDDDAPTLSIDDVTVTEGDSGTTDATFTITLSAASSRTVTVFYATNDDTAGAPGDYIAEEGTVTFQPGDTSETITVAVNGDRLGEGNEAFDVDLANPTNATIPDGKGVGTIEDDDAAGITVEPTSGLTTTEAGGADTFTVVLDSRPTSDVTVQLSSSDLTEGNVSPDTLTFTPENFDTPQTVTVTGVDDNADDGDVAYEIVTSAAISDDAAYSRLDADDVSATNADDDAPAISMGDVTVTEGDTGTTDATFTVTLDRESSQTITVDFATEDGTAKQPDDYEQQSGTLTFEPGQMEKTVTVLVTGDTTDEPDETFAVELSNASNATISDGEGTGAITDDDAPPRRCTRTGTEGNDKLKGTKKPDVICGLGGDDEIQSNGNGDELYGDAGRDTIRGGKGGDTIRARDGEVDKIFCSRGRDTVEADPDDEVARDCEDVSRG